MRMNRNLDDVGEAVRQGVAYLERVQLPDGAFRAYTSFDPNMADEGIPDPSVFPTALILQCLGEVGGGDEMVRKALDYLVRERTAGGLWRHWPSEHPEFHTLPADMDDSCCASSVLVRHGRAGASDPRLLLANRDRTGRFLTWFIPRWRWRGGQHARQTLPHLLHPVILTFFFKKTSAAQGDIDAGVNANALHYLGAFPGHEAVVDYLLAILRDGGEADADKWYDNRFVLWYLFARGLAPLTAEAAPLILARLETAKPANALERALMISTMLRCGHRPDIADIAQLLAEQSGDGSWRRAAVYFGGRERRRDGTLAPAHPDTPRWGSEELTTAFAVEGLARYVIACAEGSRS